tara:strand:- start:3734 stop:4390 length:657 start_codon:yes stop_codon:yes gene_type:complete
MMNIIYNILAGAAGIFVGYILKLAVNWLRIDDYEIRGHTYTLEIICGALFLWSFLHMPINEAIIFSHIASILVAIGIVDYHTMQIPLLFILGGIVMALAGILIGLISWTAVFWGIFIGAFIPGMIMCITWLITKRQGMGYGDIQMGIVLGAWLGPMRMALTLFGAAVLSLLTWIFISIRKGFDRDRALPFAPFLALAGIGIYIGSVYYPSFFYILNTQ